ncbi:MAG: hypothetical protein AAGJ84_12820, partial [Pseudomonadota bacterium]
EGSGRGIRELADHMDNQDVVASEVLIFTHWDYHGYGSDRVSAVRFNADSVVLDMTVLITELRRLDPKRKFGALSVSEWIEWFFRVRDHAQANPSHVFRSQFFV